MRPSDQQRMQHSDPLSTFECISPRTQIYYTIILQLPFHRPHMASLLLKPDVGKMIVYFIYLPCLSPPSRPTSRPSIRLGCRTKVCSYTILRQPCSVHEWKTYWIQRCVRHYTHVRAMPPIQPWPAKTPFQPERTTVRPGAPLNIYRIHVLTVMMEAIHVIVINPDTFQARIVQSMLVVL